MEFQEGCGLLELALLLVAALGLDLAELLQGFLELAGESLAVQAEGGEGAVGVDDIEVDASLIGRWVGGAVEERGFEVRNAVEAPGGVGEFLGELGFGGSGGLIFVEELAAVALIGGEVLGSQDGGLAGKAVGEGVLRRPLFAGGGAGAGGMLGVGAIDGGATFVWAARHSAACALLSQSPATKARVGLPFRLELRARASARQPTIDGIGCGRCWSLGCVCHLCHLGHRSSTGGRRSCETGDGCCWVGREDW